MELIIKPSKDSRSKLENLGYHVYDFDARFTKWRKSQLKSKLITPEIFSLSYDSLLSDLYNSLFIFVDRKEDYELIKSKFKILEYNE